MSTPTSRAALAVAAAGILAACDPSAVPGTSDRASVVVGGRAFTVAAPPGFCVDPESTNTSASGAFVMVADCGLLVPAEGDSGAVGAVMTASISAAALDGSLAEVARFGETAEGRALLSRSGRGDRARVVAQRTRGDQIYLLIEDRGPQPLAGVESRFWRGFLEVDGRMTVISFLGFEGADIDPGEALGHLYGFADAIAAANGG